MARDDSDLDQRRTRIYAARRAGDVPTLVGALRDPDLRAFAARSLAKVGDRAAAPHLAPLLHASDPACRIEAARALGELRSEEHVHELISLSETDPDPLVRRWTLASLGYLDPAVVLPTLRAALHNGDRQIRQAAAVGLGHARSPEALTLLRQAIHHEPLWHRGPYRRAIKEAGQRADP
jgi:HEAT repeat protein